MLGEQAMEARHTNVIESVHLVVHDLGRDGGLFGHRKVGSTCRDDQNRPMAVRAWHTSLDDSRVWVEPGVGHDFGNAVERLRVGSRHEQSIASAGDGTGNAGDLVRCLALTEDDFGESPAGPALVIDPGVAEVFCREPREDQALGLGRIQSSGLNLDEDIGDRGLAQERFVV